jgi:gas vesicle protein
MAKSSSKIVLAGLAGLAVGVAAGVLMAPKKGSKTRKRLKRKFREMKDIVQQGDFPDTLEKLKSIFIKTKEDNFENEPPSTNEDQTKP